jgi:hypothetical protein
MMRRGGIRSRRSMRKVNFDGRGWWFYEWRGFVIDLRGVRRNTLTLVTTTERGGLI